MSLTARPAVGQVPDAAESRKPRAGVRIVAVLRFAAMTGLPELRQALRLPHATAMVVGTIIGASIFVQPSEMSGALPSIPGLLLAWIVAGALTVVGSLICAELSSAYPRTGGVYVFLNETLSPAAGFLWAWAMFWSMHSGIIAAHRDHLRAVPRVLGPALAIGRSACGSRRHPPAVGHQLRRRPVREPRSVGVHRRKTRSPWAA